VGYKHDLGQLKEV